LVPSDLKNASISSMNSLSHNHSLTLPNSVLPKMLPPEAQKKMQCWIRSRHLICSGNFFVFETVDYSAVDRFSESVTALGGTIISVDPVGKIWMGDHRQVLLYRAKASLHTPCHALKQYWLKYGGFRTRFDPQD
jgi:phycoerythrin-associated linker protein